MIFNFKKVNKLISNEEKQSFFLLTFLLTIGMFLEIFSISGVFSTVDIISNGSNSKQYDFFVKIMSFLSVDSDFIIPFVLSGLIIIYSIKNTYLIYLTFKQNKFIAKFSASIDYKLYSSYINKSYAYHVGRDLGEIIKNIQVELNHFIVYFNSFLQIIIELSLTISILITLFYIAPIGSLAIGVIFLVLSITYLKITRKRLTDWGKRRRDLSTSSSNILLESLNAIKELKLFGMESHFKNIYGEKLKNIIPLTSNFNTISQSPRFFLEVISIIGMGVFIIIYTKLGYDFLALIPLLSVCVASVFRIIPSLNRIIGSFQNIKYYASSVDVVTDAYEDINSFKKEILSSKTKIEYKHSLKFKDVNFSYKKNENIIENFNFEINKGSFVGIFGNSGSGKSTLLNLICGLIDPVSGNVSVDSKDISVNITDWRKQIGYVSQDIILLNDSIQNNIIFGAENIDTKRIQEILKKTKLDEFVLSLKNGLNTKVGERAIKISGGQKQRIGIARALYREPSLLILDEATSALDSKTSNQIIDTINNFKSNMTIIFVSHDLKILKNCDSIYELKNKQLQII